MTATSFTAFLVGALHLALQLFFIGRALIRPNREPASRLAWVIVILAAPIVGMIAYVLVGETNIGRSRVARLREVFRRLPAAAEIAGPEAKVPERFAPLFQMGASINGYLPVGGNKAELLADSDAAIDAIVADIDAAREHVHVLFYIWLADNNGLKVVEALMRAAARGVQCRAMADGLGSRAMIRSAHWKAMKAAGVILAVAMPLGVPLPFMWGRVDMRNHRKIVVIDNRITYCGSQNCADPAFAVKARYAPWVDLMMRFEGPVVRQNQHLFVSDWMSRVDEDLADLLLQPVEAVAGGFPAQVIGSGAAVRPSAMPEVFGALMAAARRELVISTPYYVPDETIQAALCASAYRGVATTLILPERNDSRIVAAASRSYYAELLAAGVRLYEYRGGLLHTKSLTIDGEVALIGSANIDRRSFELNFENNILLCDPTATAAVCQRQQTYLQSSFPIELEAVAAWSQGRRLLNNAVAMFGPVL